MQETGPTVYRPYPRRLEDILLAYFEILSTCWSGLGLEPETSRTIVRNIPEICPFCIIVSTLVFVQTLTVNFVSVKS